MPVVGGMRKHLAKGNAKALGALGRALGDSHNSVRHGTCVLNCLESPKRDFAVAELALGDTHKPGAILPSLKPFSLERFLLLRETAFGDTHKVKTGVRLGKMSFRLVVVPKRASISFGLVTTTIGAANLGVVIGGASAFIGHAACGGIQSRVFVE